MRSVRPATLAGLLFLPLLWAPMMSKACAGDHADHYRVSQDPSIGYAVPIQHVYQFPAALVFQPGPAIPFGGVMNSAYDQYAGPSFIPC